MKSRWRELDIPVRASMIIGTVSGAVQLFFVAPLFQVGVVFLNPMIFVEDPIALFYFAIWAFVSLTPFFLIGATSALISKPLTLEFRGILGFLLFVGGIVSPIFLLTLVALS